ncbi:ARS binding protein Abp2 [Purpureocillium lavendulum]|uniref:ARS binding protein Abp2 n=1 Tax=Purpureocillium lavendulum TaxID=1247861 RepID=A0AB34FJT4_9HYPO|nr:ARS binding protein Abp2 [Purpureocillium lavendulum]
MVGMARQQEEHNQQDHHQQQQLQHHHQQQQQQQQHQHQHHHQQQQQHSQQQPKQEQPVDETASAIAAATDAIRFQSGFTTRPGLPDRNVTADTIEDAYVRFIFYCNPAVRLSVNTDTLREAFRNPPKSGGKAFHPFTVYELVRRFYAKEIRTWTDLTIMLGVEPPDPNKDESSQKISQYGVRLKKWMNSMHVKAFFEYLMDVPNEYWTNIPTDLNPIAWPVRDGVAIEDDMALRAVVPEIRPKRGRKRGDPEPAGGSAPRRRRKTPPSAVENYSNGKQPWTARPDSRPQLPTDTNRPNNEAGYEAVQTSLGRWPQSAVTPTTRGNFWDDALEPHSAVTPSRPRQAHPRRGAKNVSSAWKTGPNDSGGKQRGRPPINRTPVESSPSVNQHWTPAHDANDDSPAYPKAPEHYNYAHSQYQPTSQPPMGDQVPHPASLAPDMQRHHASSHEGTRPARPSISLQVPERQGGPVRLATPPPPPQAAPPPPDVIMNGQPNGQATEQGGAERRFVPSGPSAPDPNQGPSNRWQRFAKEATDAYEQAASVPGTGCDPPDEMPEYYFERMEDRTNVDGLLSYFVRSMTDSEWLDADGNPGEPAGIEESTAMVNAMLQNMYKTSTSPQAFLINLAALAGSMMLVTSRPKCARMGESDGTHVYKCDWEYRFGHVKGSFTMSQYVPSTMWKPSKPDAAGEGGQDPGAGVSGAAANGEREPEVPLSADDWKRKYQALTEEMYRRNKEIHDLRSKVMSSLGREWMES